MADPFAGNLNNRPTGDARARAGQPPLTGDPRARAGVPPLTGDPRQRAGVPPLQPPRARQDPNWLQNLVKGFFDQPDRTPTVDLPTFLTNTPDALGVLDRLTTDSLTPEDQTNVANAIGGPITPAIRDDLVHQIAKWFGDRLSGNQGAVGAFANSPQGAALGSRIASNPGAIGSAMRAGAPPPAAPGAPGATGAPGAPPPGPGGDQPQPEGLPGGQSGDVDKGMTAGPLTTFSSGGPGGFIVEKTAAGAIVKAPDGTVLGRAELDPATGALKKWSFTAAPTEKNLQAAQQSGFFDSQELVTLQTGLAAPLAKIRDQELQQQKQDFDEWVATTKMQVELGQLPLENALKQAQIEASKMSAAHLATQIKAQQLQMRLQPLIEREYGVRIGKAELEMAMAEQKFPFELQELEERVLTSQQNRYEQERTMRRQQANDSFMQQMVPGMMRALGGAPRPASAPAAPAPSAPTAPAGPNQLPVGGAMAAAAQSAMANNPPGPDVAGPPEMYQKLAQGAGAQPNDPAAMLAWTAMLQQLTGRAGR